MQYAILCYHDEKVICAWSQEDDNVVMAKLAVVQDKLARQGKLGPVARLLPTTAATTLRKDREPPLVIDGPFAETKEQLLGFYVVDCADLEEALEIARELGRGQSGRRLRDAADRLSSIPGECRDVSDLAWIERRAHLGTPAGGGRAAALFPRSRHAPRRRSRRPACAR